MLVFVDSFFFFSSRRRHTRLQGDWSSDVCSSDLEEMKADVAMVSTNFWRKYLNSDPQVIGRSVTLNGVATTIVGVLRSEERRVGKEWWFGGLRGDAKRKDRAST